MGGLYGHSGRGRRLRRPRRYSRPVGAAIRIHQHGIGPHHRGRFDRFRRHHHSFKPHRGQSRLWHPNVQRIRAAWVVGHSDPGSGNGFCIRRQTSGSSLFDRRHVSFCDGQRTLRGRRQSPGGLALSKEEGSLPQYSPCRLAGRLDPRRAGFILHVGRRYSGAPGKSRCACS